MGRIQISICCTPLYMNPFCIHACSQVSRVGTPEWRRAHVLLNEAASSKWYSCMRGFNNCASPAPMLDIRQRLLVRKGSGWGYLALPFCRAGCLFNFGIADQPFIVEGSLRLGN